MADEQADLEQQPEDSAAEAPPAADDPTPEAEPAPAVVEPVSDPAEDALFGAVGSLDQAAIDAILAGGPAEARRRETAPPSVPFTPPAPSRSASSTPATTARPTARAQRVGDLDLLADVVLILSAEIGRAEKTIEDVLKLRPGSLIELDKLAGEPVELYVNDRCIARGEVVVVDDNFGIRITELGPGH